MKEISEVLLSGENVIFLEDTNKDDRFEIKESRVRLDKYFAGLNNQNDIIVISNKNNREYVFQEAIDANILIDFEAVGKMKYDDFDVTKFKDKTVLFYKCFEGMTSSENKTYKNVSKIIKISKQYIGIEAIGINYLEPYYFNATLRLIGKKEVNPMIKKELNNALTNSLYVINNNKFIKKVDKDYWVSYYGEEFNNDEYFNYESTYTNREAFYLNKEDNKRNDNVISKSGVEMDYRKQLSGLNYDFDKDNYFDEQESKFNYEEDIFDESIPSFKSKNNSREINDTLMRLILCMFGLIGFAGIHHFYNKKYVLGIVYLLTLGFWTIGTFIDIIRYSTQLYEAKKGPNHMNKLYKDHSNRNY